MSVSKKNYTSNEKLKMVLEVLQNNEPVSAICQKHGISKSALQEWVNTLKNRGNSVYDKNNIQSREIISLEKELEETRARLGEALVENSFLKKASSLVRAKRIK